MEVVLLSEVEQARARSEGGDPGERGSSAEAVEVSSPRDVSVERPWEVDWK